MPFALLSVAAVIALAAYGLNTFLLVALYLRHRQDEIPRPPALRNPPKVTVQLPVYNERHVVERIIEAAAGLHYPRNRLQIQVLDDSSDATSALARRRVARMRNMGVDIVWIHRSRRTGFKAGALQEGLAQATGEFLAVFDADFLPPPDFLEATIPYLVADPRAALVQTRWSHLNAPASLLTRAQALALDGHFVVEQTARQRSGLFMNFNGSGGVWRRACIEAVGGWHHDTLCEDLDLSYRAQLAGWRCLYLPHVTSPAELPGHIQALKRQQFRWAKGSLQCALKLGPGLLRSRHPWIVRLQGLIHLTGYLVHPLMLVLLLASVPILLLGQPFGLPLAYLSLASLGPPLLYLLGQRALHEDWRRRFARFPGLMLLGTGIALNNAAAIWEAATGRPNRFRRTPKYGGAGKPSGADDYRLPLDALALGEVGLAGYALLAGWIASATGALAAIPFLLLYAAGFGWVGMMSVAEAVRGRRRSLGGLELPRRRRPRGISFLGAARRH
ncbi:MAG: glycosyltransferase [Anaerolineae bacterium]